jgi:cell wall integrity and stress response component
MRYFTVATATSAVLAGVVTAQGTPTTTAKGVQRPSSRPITLAPVVQGCWASSEGLKLVNASVQYNTGDKCGKEICQKQNYKVAATYQGSQCWCGNVYPPASQLVDDKNCNVECPGYDYDACGGPSAWTVYNTGIELYGISNAPDPSSSTSAPSSTSKPTETAANPAASQTSEAAPSSSSSSSSGGSNNTAAIAAGVVIGLVALAAIGGGLWFFFRRRRNREIEEEHRRNAAVNAFIHGNKPPGSSGGVSLTDSRMDPVMAQRRMSDGSIADNQDYSRRILRVTNA